MFDALFKVVSTLFGPLTIEKRIEHPAFHLLFLLPKSSFGEHNLFSYVFYPRRESATFLARHSGHSERFARPYKIFVSDE